MWETGSTTLTHETLTVAELIHLRARSPQLEPLFCMLHEAPLSAREPGGADMAGGWALPRLATLEDGGGWSGLMMAGTSRLRCAGGAVNMMSPLQPASTSLHLIFPVHSRPFLRLLPAAVALLHSRSIPRPSASYPQRHIHSASLGSYYASRTN